MADLPAEVARTLIRNEGIRFKSASWCMFPIIWEGDILKIEPIGPEEARIGDIILYKSAGRAFAHRLIKIYEKEDRLYALTGGEKEYVNNSTDRGDAVIAADNILGKVSEIKRGRARFSPSHAKIGSVSLMNGKLRMSLHDIRYRFRKKVIKIFTALQGFRSYRYFFRKIMKDKVSFFIGIPIMMDESGITGSYAYKRIGDVSGDLACDKNSYNISAKIFNLPVGNISLYFEREEDSLNKVCILSNFVIKAPLRGAGIGEGLLEKALDICDKMAIQEVSVVLNPDDRTGLNLFKKAGFNIGG